MVYLRFFSLEKFNKQATFSSSTIIEGLKMCGVNQSEVISGKTIRRALNASTASRDIRKRAAVAKYIAVARCERYTF